MRRFKYQTASDKEEKKERNSLSRTCSLVLQLYTTDIYRGPLSSVTMLALRAAGENYSEKNGKFIVNVLQLLTKQNLSLKQVNPQGVNGSRDGKGVYVFFANDARDSFIPIYIGITSRNFQERFAEHRRNGVIQKYSDREGKNPDLYLVNDFGKQLPPNWSLAVAEFKVDTPMVAKMYESIFLTAFNFPLNTEENEGARPDIRLCDRQNKPCDSFRIFTTAHHQLMRDLESVRDFFSEEDGLHKLMEELFLKFGMDCSA